MSSIEVLVVVQLIEGENRFVNIARTESVQPAVRPDELHDGNDGGFTALVAATMTRLVDETRADALGQVEQISGLLNA